MRDDAPNGTSVEPAGADGFIGGSGLVCRRVPGRTAEERRRYIRRRVDEAPSAIVFDPDALLSEGERDVLDDLVEKLLAAERPCGT